MVLVSTLLIWTLGFDSCNGKDPTLPVEDTILVEGIDRTVFDLHNLQLGINGFVWGSRGRDLYLIRPGGDSVLKIFSFDAKINAIHIFRHDSMLVATDNNHFDPFSPAQVLLSTDGARSFDPVLNIQGGSALFWSIASDEQDRLYVGEYGPQQKGMSKTVWWSDGTGQDWRPLFQAPDRDGVHIHRVAIDPLTQDLWVSIGDGKDNRGVFRARHDSIDVFEQIADSQATAIEFTENDIYLGEDRRRKSGVTRISRHDGNSYSAIRFRDEGNYGGSVYDLAIAALWVGVGGQWTPIMLFDSRLDKGGGRETIAGPDSEGFLYITGYRINDSVVTQAVRKMATR